MDRKIEKRIIHEMQFPVILDLKDLQAAGIKLVQTLPHHIRIGTKTIPYIPCNDDYEIIDAHIF